MIDEIWQSNRLFDEGVYKREREWERSRGGLGVVVVFDIEWRVDGEGEMSHYTRGT